MKKKLLSTAILLFFSLSAALASENPSGEKSKINFSAEPFVSITKGEMGEWIFHDRTGGNPISLLEWDRNLLLFGLNLKGSFKKFHLNFGFETAVPKTSGEMRDSDWLDSTRPEVKTTYSVGRNKNLQNHDAKIELQYDFPLISSVVFSPAIQVQYSYDSFSRQKNARGWYGDREFTTDGGWHWWYDEESKRFPTEYYWSEEKQKYVRQVLSQIDYRRHSFYTWLGANLRILATQKLTFDFSVLASGFAYTSAEDVHHSSRANKIYHEIQKSWWKHTKNRFRANYAFTDRIALFAEGEVLFGRLSKGDFYSGWTLNSSQPSGSDTQQMSFKAGCTINFF